jgi:hypothetical protein
MKSCDIVGGRIRTTCSRCKKVTYTEVAADSREKIVRCSCGKSEVYEINNRRSTRDSTAGSAEIFFADKCESKIHLFDASDTGIGFYVPEDVAALLHPGQEITFKNKSREGEVAQRRMLITSVSGNRVGAKYPETDSAF